MKSKPGAYHLNLSVSDGARSKRFYDAFFRQLKWRRMYSDPDAGGYSDGNFTVWVIPAEKKGRHLFKAVGFHHFAILVASKKDVDAFYRWAKRNKIMVVDAPALYPQYNKNYYAVFILDPDGLKLEVVYNPVAGI